MSITRTKPAICARDQVLLLRLEDLPVANPELFISPLSRRVPRKIAPQIHREDRQTDKHRAANDDPWRQVGIHNGVEHAQKKGSLCRRDARASFKPHFCHGERARRPRNQLDDDGVEQRGDVQCA